MAGFRAQRLVARDPRGTVGFRTIAAGAHRVRLALLRGGGSLAVAVLHPAPERPRRNPGVLARLLGLGAQPRATKRTGGRTRPTLLEQGKWRGFTSRAAEDAWRRAGKPAHFRNYF